MNLYLLEFISIYLIYGESLFEIICNNKRDNAEERDENVI